MESPRLTRVAIVGAGGQMGSAACGWIETWPEFECAARLGDELQFAAELERNHCELYLDFTRAGLGAEHARRVLQSGARAVIGTSGVTPEEFEGLLELSAQRELGGLIAPNFCLGMIQMQAAAEDLLRPGTRVELVEQHRPHKLDAPSASSLSSARKLREKLEHMALESDTSSAGSPAAVGEIPIHSVRKDGPVARQEWILTRDGEELRLVHQIDDRGAFAPGLRAALRWARDARDFRWGLEAIMGKGLL